MYDPETGLYDPDVATFNLQTGYGVWQSSHPVMFMPDTTSCARPMAMGAPSTDAITSQCSQWRFVLQLGADELATEPHLAFAASQELTFWAQRPDGAFVFRDSLASCVQMSSALFQEEGQYVFTIAYGALGGSGEFALGIAEQSGQPSPYLCGDIDGTLDEQFPVYFAINEFFTGPADTVHVVNGIHIELLEGGRIAAPTTLLAQQPSGSFVLRPGQVNRDVALRTSAGTWLSPAREKYGIAAKRNRNQISR